MPSTTPARFGRAEIAEATVVAVAVLAACIGQDITGSRPALRVRAHLRAGRQSMGILAVCRAHAHAHAQRRVRMVFGILTAARIENS